MQKKYVVRLTDEEPEGAACSDLVEGGCGGAELDGSADCGSLRLSHEDGGECSCAFGNGAKSCGPCWWVVGAGGFGGAGLLGRSGRGGRGCALADDWEGSCMAAVAGPQRLRGNSQTGRGESAAVAKASAGHGQQWWGCEGDAVWPSMDVWAPLRGSRNIWTGGRTEPGRRRRLRWNSRFRRWRNLRFEFPSGRGPVVSRKCTPG
jgi:hypothetical protein